MASHNVTAVRPPDTFSPADERWALIQRVVAGQALARAPQLRGFLLFVSERVLTGHLNEINEYEIGRMVLGRRADFNPHEDNIVRVRAVISARNWNSISKPRERMSRSSSPSPGDRTCPSSRAGRRLSRPPLPCPIPRRRPHPHRLRRVFGSLQVFCCWWRLLWRLPGCSANLRAL